MSVRSCPRRATARDFRAERISLKYGQRIKTRRRLGVRGDEPADSRAIVAHPEYDNPLAVRVVAIELLLGHIASRAGLSHDCTPGIVQEMRQLSAVFSSHPNRPDVVGKEQPRALWWDYRAAGKRLVRRA
jgi:hypothetical protein